jgi:pimeloyl-ACP methyl ester carboxylesterase
MPVLRREDAEIYYEEYGQGFPILLFAPGGMRSRSEMWHSPPGGPPRSWNDWTEVLAGHFRVIAMDQRNAGNSRAGIAADHGWHTYAADHLALMDHLGHQRFHTLGGCIGASFCLTLCEMVPERVATAVLQNPIGLHPEFPEYFPEGFVEWTAEQRAVRPELDEAAMRAFGRNMWGGEFVFCVSRDFVRRCPVPTMLLPGTDKAHPAATAAELAVLLPGVEVLQDWKGPEHLETQRSRVLAFLEKHTPN